MAKNNKLGLYAQYTKIDGSLIRTAIKKESDVYKSNRDSPDMFWELITEDENLMYQDDVSVPKISPNWDEDMEREIDPDHIQCVLCLNYFKKEEMCYIPSFEEEQEGVLCLCKHCDVNCDECL